MGSRMNNTLLLVQSEFGRTVQENGASGTDHGFGGFMFAVGNMLKANPKGLGALGQYKSLGDLKDGRYQQVTTDFRTVYSEALERLFGFDPYRSKIFPAYKGNTSNYLDFLKPVAQA
jgi:uncharacterized protein (DUF1501 family)